ncbi:diguanylate cyclase [Lentzea sp. PSKA42]|uniref:Diguanylate cyclase n=1 Tax=Lentzea indica TaxID=2604800 RepID=A0ABX1FS87_9PSEU|nr:diguanylate cyclase [Lentzea indica]
MSFWEGRATARVATAGLTAGLLVLAGLALWSSVSAQATTAHVRELNETSERWSRVLEHINVADNALRDLQVARTERTIEPLRNSVGSARGELEWLRTSGTQSDTAVAGRLLPLYDQTTDILRKVIAGEDPLQADQASLAHSSLRRQISSTIGAKRLDTTEYLRAADEKNAQLRVAQIVAFVLDAFLVGLFGMVLLGYRRKILRQAAKNEHEAHHDALTGLANRSLLARRMELAVTKARKKDEPLALLIVDLDRFKEVNDSLGHHSGDLLLRQVANRLSWAVRDTDLVARLGGDEFAVLLPGVGSAENARMVADKILSALAMPVTLEGLELEIAGSVGVALCPSDSGDGHELLRHADIAMYAAKREKSGVAVYDARLHERGAAHLTAVTELRHAIDRGELFLHYQPKALADTGAVCGVGGPGALAASDARPGPSRRVHPDRRGERSHRAADPLRDRRGVAPVPCVVRRGLGGPGVGERGRGLPAPHRVPRRRGRPDQAARVARAAADPGDHRVRDHLRPGPSRGGVARLDRARRATVHRRLRHRILVDLVPAQHAGARDEARPFIRHAHVHRRRRQRDRARPRGAGPQLRAAGRRGGRGGPGHLDRAGRGRVRRRPGLLPQRAVARRGHRCLAGRSGGRSRVGIGVPPLVEERLHELDHGGQLVRARQVRDHPDRAHRVDEPEDFLVEGAQPVPGRAAVVSGFELQAEAAQVPLDRAPGDELEVGEQRTVRAGEDVRGRRVAVDGLQLDAGEGLPELAFVADERLQDLPLLLCSGEVGRVDDVGMVFELGEGFPDEPRFR